MKKKRPNFIKKYLSACGRTEVPMPFHMWSCISLIGALLGDRVWYQKHAGDKLYPNLYTILIGESASGKGSAIKRCTKIAKEVPEIFRFRGKTTGAHISDVFGAAQLEKEEKGLDEPPTIYLVFPELSDSIGEGPQANDFIKRFTNIFEAEDDLHKEGTRTHGALQYRIPIANCLFGTTEDWLYESVSKAALRSGFIARCCTIKASYDPAMRIAEPEYPKDYEDLMEWLIRAAQRIAKLKGPYQMTQEARETHTSWYENRPFPEDKAIQPSWKRADDFFYKFAMIASAAKGRESRVIASSDAADAIQMIAATQKDLSEIIHGSHRGVEIEALDTVAVYIKRAGIIPHSDLLKRCSNRGIPANGPKGVNAQCAALLERGEIAVGIMKGRDRAKAWRWLEEKLVMGGSAKAKKEKVEDDGFEEANSDEDGPL